MCGISALIETSARGVEPRRQRVCAMVQAQIHRGPDGSLVWCDERVALGHSRLRVVDLNERSNQPFFRRGDGPKAPVLVYNGELYNHVALRRRLEGHGERFRTSGDTEVLYCALRRWGGAAVRDLRGMFAFVFYDPAGGRVTAARDRSGIKPLFFAQDAEGFAFASEPQGILVSGRGAAALDDVAVHQVARFNHTLGRRSAFRGIRSLLPGEQWSIDLATMETRRERYHQHALRRSGGRFAERVERLDAAYRAAVESHLVADRPVASFLSGGIDSTALAKTASESTNLSTYSMTFPGHENDESGFIRDARGAIQGDHRTLAIHDVGFEDYESYIHHAASPQLWTTDLSLFLLSAEVRRGGHHVVLSGEGPDELFAGYDSFRWMRLRRAAQRLGLTQLLSHLPARRIRVPSLSWFDVDTAMVRFYARAHAGARGVESRYGFYPENLASWGITSAATPFPFAPDFAARFGEFEELNGDEIRAAVPPAQSALQSNLLFETNVRLPSWVLAMADRMSSAHGVELRVPYLDDGFVDVAMALPDGDRMRGLNEKYILKEMHKRRVPASIYRRHKQALYTPITPWAQRFVQHERCQDLLAGDDRFFNRDAIATLQGRLQRGAYDGMLEQLSTEWSLMLVLSTRILEAHVRTLRTQRDNSPSFASATGIE